MYMYEEMSFSLNRNAFVANKIGNLNGEKILDIGCRDKILKKYLIGSYDYTGLDYNPIIAVKEKRIDYINHNLEVGMPKNVNYDIITAIDVLEHLENIHDIFEQIFENAKKKNCNCLT